MGSASSYRRLRRRETTSKAEWKKDTWVRETIANWIRMEFQHIRSLSSTDSAETGKLANAIHSLGCELKDAPWPTDNKAAPIEVYLKKNFTRFSRNIKLPVRQQALQDIAPRTSDGAEGRESQTPGSVPPPSLPNHQGYSSHANSIAYTDAGGSNTTDTDTDHNGNTYFHFSRFPSPETECDSQQRQPPTSRELDTVPE